MKGLWWLTYFFDINFKLLAFQIGSISELCSKISTTEPVFPKYKHLLVEKSASDSVHSHTFPGQRYRKHANG